MTVARMQVIAVVIHLAVVCSAKPLPVVVWHGMGDSCCSPRSIGAVVQSIREELGVFVHSIATGSTEAKDIWTSYIGSVNEQVKQVCHELALLPELAGGYNAIGFSQGGQFMRAVVERCQDSGPTMHTLITVGAQHQGVMNVPQCVEGRNGSTPTSYCRTMQVLLEEAVYVPIIANNVVQAQYFKDPNEMTQYLAHNPFLPDINNEKEVKDPQYKINLASLKRFVLFMFRDDTVVVPQESSWFGVYDPVVKDVVPMENTTLYKEDWIGLKTLHSSGRLVFDSIPGNHMHFTLQWFKQHVVQPYLTAASNTSYPAAE